MKGPDQLPSEEDVIRTYVGTSLERPTKVEVEVRSVDEEQITFEILDVVGFGSEEPTEGQMFASDVDGFMWEAV